MGGKSGKYGRRSRGKQSSRPASPNLDNPAVRGREFEWLGVEEWIDELDDSSYEEFYSNRTRPNLESNQRRQPIGTKGFSEAQNTKGARGWLQKAFPDSRARPDFVAIDRKNKRILVGDVTKDAQSPAEIRPGGQRKLPRGIGVSEQRHHFEKTIEYAEQLAQHLPDDMRDFEVIAQDSYREQVPNKSKPVTVYRNGRFVRPSSQWRNRGLESPTSVAPDDRTAKRKRGTTDTRGTWDRGTGNTGSMARQGEGKPQSGSQATLPKAKIIKTRGKTLDLKKIRESVAKALKPRVGVAKNLAKGVAKGLVVGYVVGLLESYLFNKFAGWLLKDEGVKRLNELDKRKGPEIERRMQEAVEDHVKKLARQPGTAYKIVMEYRLVTRFAIGDIYLPDDLLIDKVYVTEFFWTKKETCTEAKVTPDVTEVTFVGRGGVFREGEVITVHESEDLFRVFKCTRILDFDYPDVGDPPLEGEWRAFFIDKNGPDKQHLATYTIRSSGNEKNPGISGVIPFNNQKLQIWDVEWTGHFLKFKVKHGKYTEHITMSFDEWDVLTGWSDLYEGYSRVQPSMPQRWERITEFEKQLVENLKKAAAYINNLSAHKGSGTR